MSKSDESNQNPDFAIEVTALLDGSFRASFHYKGRTLVTGDFPTAHEAQLQALIHFQRYIANRLAAS